MPLSVLLPMVVIGIAGIVGLLHLLGLSRTRAFADEADARGAWLREFPEAVPIRVVLCHDHSAALIETADGPGAVFPMGADSTARYLTGARLTPRADGLDIRLPDFTAPRLRLRLDPDEVALWRADLERSA